MYQESGIREILTKSLNDPIDSKLLMTTGRAFHNTGHTKLSPGMDFQ